MKNKLLTDIFLYFARFVEKESVLKLFNAGRSERPGYDDFKAEIDKLSHIAPQIPDFVFAANFEAVRKRVNNIEGLYLFVDYGEIECATDEINRMTDSVQLACTVAFRLSSFDSDLIEQLLVQDEALAALMDIRNKMIEEQREYPWLKDISLAHSFAPFLAPELQSIGWTLFFSREGYDSFGAKKNN